MLKKAWLLGMEIVAALTLFQSGIRAADQDVDHKPDMSKVPPASDKKGLTFAKDVQPILTKSCAKCHGGDRPKSKYSMDTLASVIKGGKSGHPAVVPGHSDKSPMVLFTSDAVEDMEMPPTEKRDRYPALTKEQIGILRAWIDQGAK
jgi:Planctomycete cytochrome C